MPAIVSLLRAVNLGSHNKIKMESLRDLYLKLGLRHAQTYVQSGNVVFETRSTDLVKLARKIEDALDETFAIRTPVILRTTADLRSVVKRNPFAGQFEILPNHLLVSFLREHPDAEAPDRLAKIKAHPDILHLDARELYIYYNAGAGKTKLTPAALERALKIPGTARNWNTILKLLEMSEAIDAR